MIFHAFFWRFSRFLCERPPWRLGEICQFLTGWFTHCHGLIWWKRRDLAPRSAVFFSRKSKGWKLVEEKFDGVCIYIYGCRPPKTYVSYKHSGIYSVSRTFWPLDFGSFFWGGTICKWYIQNKWYVCNEETLKKHLYSCSCPIWCNKTEKLKNRIHMENLFLDLSGKNSFSVFQFFRKYSGIVPEPKLKNWKTEKLNFIRIACSCDTLDSS